MLILALESSAVAASCCLCRDGKLLAQSFQNNGLTHSRTLLPMVTAMLQNCDLTLEAVDAFAVAVGPGSFTGLRIGISAVKGLAWAAEKPVCGVSTLEAMAYNLGAEDALICCAMDARRKQVYNALFRAEAGQLIRLTPDRAIAVEELFREEALQNRPVLLVGDGAQLCYAHATGLGLPVKLAPEHLRQQSAWGVALAALQHWDPAADHSAGQLKPNYLRLSQAERERLERGSTQRLPGDR